MRRATGGVCDGRARASPRRGLGLSVRPIHHRVRQQPPGADPREWRATSRVPRHRPKRCSTSRSATASPSSPSPACCIVPSTGPARARPGRSKSCAEASRSGATSSWARRIARGRWSASRTPRQLAGRIDDALGSLDQALAVATATGSEFYSAEALRMRGELRANAGDAGGIADIEHALDLARRQEARAFELRAALSLARVPGHSAGRAPRCCAPWTASHPTRPTRISARPARSSGSDGARTQREQAGRDPRRRHGRPCGGMALSAPELRDEFDDHRVPARLAARRERRPAAVASTAGSRSTACTCGSATTTTRSGSCARSTTSSTARNRPRPARSRPGATRSARPNEWASATRSGTTGPTGLRPSARTTRNLVQPAPQGVLCPWRRSSAGAFASCWTSRVVDPPRAHSRPASCSSGRPDPPRAAGRRIAAGRNGRGAAPSRDRGHGGRRGSDPPARDRAAAWRAACGNGARVPRADARWTWPRDCAGQHDGRRAGRRRGPRDHLPGGRHP